MAVDVDECLHRYGPRPVGEVCGRRRVHIRLERQAQGDGDTELMKLCCVQLFNADSLDDVLLIWMAECADMDADCSIGIQLLCGSGLAGAKAYLFSQCLPEAEAALQGLRDCEKAGGFEAFSVEGYSARYAAYCTP